MTVSDSERDVMRRFYLKCRLAGGPRAGYMLRRAAILSAEPEGGELDLETGIRSLVEREWLVVGEDESFLYHTTAGAEALSELFEA